MSKITSRRSFVYSQILVAVIAGKVHAQAPAAYDSGITPAGAWLASFLDHLDVEHHWLRSHERIAWKTGLPLKKEHGKDTTPLVDDETHCSAFAAAVADDLGIYLLHPPEHSHVLLANAQYDWLAGDAGRKAGWRPVDDPLDAQQAANRGELVVAVYKNPDPKHAGHIAIIRPSSDPAEEIREKGPQITQAGFNNHGSADLVIGFGYHPGAWAPGGKGGLKFYAHEVDGAKLAGE